MQALGSLFSFVYFRLMEIQQKKGENEPVSVRGHKGLKAVWRRMFEILFTSQGKVEDIVKWPVPKHKNGSSLLSVWLSIIENFVGGFSDIVAPLTSPCYKTQPNKVV